MRHLYEKKKGQPYPKQIVLLKKCKKKNIKKNKFKEKYIQNSPFLQIKQQKMSIVRRAIPRLVKIIEKG